MKVKSLLSTGVFVAAIFFATKTEAQSIITPRVASPAAKLSQTVSISKVTIKYSRPAGSYGLFVAVIENDEATFNLSENTSSWGSFFMMKKKMC